MTLHLYIVTGASRGLGLAMAAQLLSPHQLVLCISRHSNETLTSHAVKLGGQLEQWQQDLEHSPAVATLLGQWLGQHGADTFTSATLINNAGVMPSIGPLNEADPQDLSRTLRVGLETPLLLSSAFLHATENWNIPRKILNISSGLGRRAMASQAGYCAAKAGMDHFTRCLTLEEALKPYGAKVCSLAPGVIDTDMQLQLRDANAQAFPDLQRFLALKVNGQLTAPAVAAAHVLAFLRHPDFGCTPVADLRDEPVGSQLPPIRVPERGQ